MDVRADTIRRPEEDDVAPGQEVGSPVLVRTDDGRLQAGGTPMNERRRPITAMLLLLLLTLAPPAARAQDESGTTPWSIEVAPYLWLSEVQGTIGVRDTTAHLDVTFDKLFDLMGNGELFAGGGHAEVRHDRFSFFLDAFGGTARPTSDVTVGREVQRSGTADVTVNWSFFEFGPSYRLLRWPTDGPGRPITIDALVGGRLMYFYQSLTLRGELGNFNRFASASSTWVDPFVGGRFAVPIWDQLDVVFRADIGGFGAGSELAWSLLAGFQYILPWQPGGGQTSIVAVYKALDFDHESDDGTVRASANISGPGLGLLFRF